MTEFASPASAVGIAWADLKGALIIADVHSVEQGIKTAFGDTDAVRADVHVLDGPGQGTSYNDTLVFPRVLRSQLGPNVGRKVLGRVGQGNAKPGQSAPWLVVDATADDQKTGAAWLAGHTVAPHTGPRGAPPF